MGAIFGFAGYGVTPGISGVTKSVEANLVWGDSRHVLNQSYQIDGAARDAGNSPTTVLRPGLLMGIVTATGKAKQYDPVASDGTEVVAGILMEAVRVTDLDGGNQDLFLPLITSGPIKVAPLIGFDQQARNQMLGRFVFDDDPLRNSTQYPFLRMVPKTADYTVVLPADNNTCFTTRGAAGAVVFTLPAPTAALKGMRVSFLNEVNQNLTIGCATADVIVCFNDAGADTVAFSTSGEKIGAYAQAFVNDDGSKWYVLPLCNNTVTITT